MGGGGRSTESGDEGPFRRKSGLGILHRKDLHSNGSVVKENKKKSEAVMVGGLKPALGPSKPSVSIDGVTINGMTTPPVSGTPPLTKTLSRSPTTPSATSRHYSEIQPGKSPTVLDRENNFHGLFTPGYLQLLDTQPTSLPPISTTSPMTSSKRALTAPNLPLNSLPSALRAASGKV